MYIIMYIMYMFIYNIFIEYFLKSLQRQATALVDAMDDLVGFVVYGVLHDAMPLSST